LDPGDTPNDPPGLSSMGVGRKALKALPPSATRGRARDRSASNSVASRFNVRSARNSFRRNSVASRFNVRSARNSFRRPQIHPRAVGKLTAVTICRELRHSDQTIQSQHVGTDRQRKTTDATLEPTTVYLSCAEIALPTRRKSTATNKTIIEDTIPFITPSAQLRSPSLSRIPACSHLRVSGRLPHLR
jgi:hypothetical protein